MVSFGGSKVTIAEIDMVRADRLPQYVVIQHTFSEHREILMRKLDERHSVPPLAYACQEGEIGTWQGLQIACYSGPARETTLVPILEQSTVEYVFSLGLAGALSKRLQRGDLVLPIASVRGDGLTDYWADSKMPAVADTSALLALNESAHRLGASLANGIFYTTSTLYRETTFVNKWAELGVVGVEMELAQHFLLSHLHGKKAAGLYVISDSPLEGDEIWRTGISLDGILSKSYEYAVDIVLAAIQLLSDSQPVENQH